MPEVLAEMAGGEVEMQAVVVAGHPATDLEEVKTQRVELHPGNVDDREPATKGGEQAWSAFRRRHQAVAKVCHSRRRTAHQPASLDRPPLQRLEPITLELTDEHWQRVAPLLPPQKPQTGRPNNDHQMILAGMLWVARTGASWRDLPEQFGPWETVHSRYQRWRKAGLWQQILDALNSPATHNAP